ncbi:MAG: carboxymuconolactone decarboxylase family protein [Burkholderiales bacterium]
MGSRRAADHTNHADCIGRSATKEHCTHIRGALNNGCTKAEIREVLLQCGIYAGIPVLREAVRVAQEVFAEEAKAGKRVK